LNDLIAKLADTVLSDNLLETQQINALAAETASLENIEDLLYFSEKIRRKHFSNKIKLCSIVPARLGGCNQDCKFCAQSAHYKTAVKGTTTLTEDEIITAARQAARNGVKNFGIVYSGESITDRELAKLENLIPKIKELGLNVCGSLGIVSPQKAKKLKAAGIDRYNHNLETSRNHFPEVVTTHCYDDRLDSIKNSLDAGLALCAGAIFGIGETDSDRIDIALELRKLNVDTVPMNFLHPIEGTPMDRLAPLLPLQILRIIALYRFILPRTTLKAAGGRVLNLRDLQSWIFRAGANSILTGNYLTTAGRSAEDDKKMLEDLKLVAI
jgi:biotin synthase